MRQLAVAIGVLALGCIGQASAAQPPSPAPAQKGAVDFRGYWRWVTEQETTWDGKCRTGDLVIKAGQDGRAGEFEVFHFGSTEGAGGAQVIKVGSDRVLPVVNIEMDDVQGAPLATELIGSSFQPCRS